MTRLDFSWPDEGGETVRAARSRLEVAGRLLAQRPFEERLAAVSRSVEAWSAADSPWRRELGERLASHSSFHPDTLVEGLDSALRAWDPEAFRACARREIEEAVVSGRLELAPFACTSVLAGGALPMPTILSGLLPLVLGSPVLMRETSKDPITGDVLARSIGHDDEDLGACIEVVRFPVEDEVAMNAFLESECVVATGSDETVAAIRDRLDSNQRFVAYGHRFSIAVLGPETTRIEGWIESTVGELALDIARWDQLGCLSPVDIYLVGLTTAESRNIAEALAAALAELSGSMPRGTHSDEVLAAHALERMEARMRAAASDSGAFFEGPDFAISLETDARPRPAPLVRFSHLLPVDSLEDLERALTPLASHLSNAAVSGFTKRDTKRIEGLMTHLGVSRICTPGRLQTPPIDWPHDGMPLFTPMARFVQWE